MNKDLIHTPTNSKKVNYVIVLDLLDRTPLKTITSELAIKAAIDREGFGLTIPPPHVNQIAYHAIANSLIAISIETKTKSAISDPLLQLGI